MSAPPSTRLIDTAVAGLEAALDAVAALPLDACTDAEIVEMWQRVETVRRRLEPVDHAIVAQVRERSLAFRHGYRSTAMFARHALRITPAEATARARAADAAGPRRTVTGEPLEAIHPAVAAAQAVGSISARHARIITDTVTHLPDAVAAECDRAVEGLLVEFAGQHDPDRLAAHARDLAAALDPDGLLRDLAYRDRARSFEFHRRPDGSAHGHFDLTPEAAEHLHTHLDTLTHPRHHDVDTEVRTATQRRHDAVLAMLKLVERAELLPTAGGVSGTIVLTMEAEAYAATGVDARTATATTGHGYRVPAETAKRWAGAEARTVAVLLSRTRAITAYSHTMRLFTEQQRLALIARDKGCAFPGCDAPPQWTEVHHVIEYERGGPTTTDNAVLLCTHDHHNFAVMGWRVDMDAGRPVWTPPAWIDPDRSPRRNTMHD